MKVTRYYVELIASNLRQDVKHFRESGTLFLGSQYNQETAAQRLKEAERLESILAQVEALLQNDQELFTLQ